ncbi:MAG: hypothetical protein KA004_05355 [Verrucomicrobiales bacterium]|nr:hypothetical protein [Verrucomicrobiales bacterium]
MEDPDARYDFLLNLLHVPAEQFPGDLSDPPFLPRHLREAQLLEENLPRIVGELTRPAGTPAPQALSSPKRLLRVRRQQIDTNGNGLFDDFERTWAVDPFAAEGTADWLAADADSDGDGLTNLQEQTLGTNPNNADTDGDGALDGRDSAAKDPTITPLCQVVTRRSGDYTANERVTTAPPPDKIIATLNWALTQPASEVMENPKCFDRFLGTGFVGEIPPFGPAWVGAPALGAVSIGLFQRGVGNHENGHFEAARIKLVQRPAQPTPTRVSFLKISRRANFGFTPPNQEWHDPALLQPGNQLPLDTSVPQAIEVVTLEIPSDVTESPELEVSGSFTEPIPSPENNNSAGQKWSLELTPVEIRQPAINSEGTVGDLETVQEVRFCRWNSPHVIPGGDLVQPQEFPKDDPDRIVIRMPLPHKAGQGVQKIHVSTSGSIGSRNDAGAEVELTELAGQLGIFESQPIALVADEDDDNWAGGRASDGALNDPTFRAWPGGILKIKVPALQDAVIDFPIKKFSHHFTCSLVHVGSVDADAASVAAMIQNLDRLHEIYAPLLEKVDFTPVNPGVGVPAISPDDLQAIAGSDHQLSSVEVNELIAKINAFDLPADAIKLVFIDKTITATSFGTNLAYKNRSDITLYFLSSLISFEGQNITKAANTVAHECGHSLRGAGHSETGGIYDPSLGPPLTDPALPWWHLMADGRLANDLSMDPPKSAKHWYLRDAKIVNEGAGNKFSKKLP